MVRKTFLWRKRLLAFWRRMYALTSADPLQREIPPHLDVKTWENCVWHAFLAAKLVSLISLIWLLNSRKASLLKRSIFLKKSKFGERGFPELSSHYRQGSKKPPRENIEKKGKGKPEWGGERRFFGGESSGSGGRRNRRYFLPVPTKLFLKRLLYFLKTRGNLKVPSIHTRKRK